METYLTFDDVLIKPRFSKISSRKKVDLSTELGSCKLKLPILAANMDTVCGVDMAVAMAKAGGAGVLHRFWSIEDNLKAGQDVFQLTEGDTPWISVGIGNEEWKRVINVAGWLGAPIVIDVAHGAQQQVADFYKRVVEQYPEATVVIGNFATPESISDFVDAAGYKFHARHDFKGIFKIGVGPGSACTTRIKTGIGVPQLSAIQDCASLGYPVIADGGCKTPGDVAKALAAGAKAVMLGGMLAGTYETPPVQRYVKAEYPGKRPPMPNEFTYRGSASQESYKDQGKDWACAEGESFTVKYKGKVAQVLQDIEGGLKSAFTYVGVDNLKDFQLMADFVQVSPIGVRENGAHGKS